MTAQPSFFTYTEHGLSMADLQTVGAVVSLTHKQESAFWTHVACGISPDDCWIWTGELNNNGYGTHRLFSGGRKGRVSRRVMAHRAAFVLTGGQIAEGQELDHLCRTRRCVNPRHLEPVTHRVNILRGNTPMAANAAKTHCVRGHEYTPANTNWYRSKRRCVACSKERVRS